MVVLFHQQAWVFRVSEHPQIHSQFHSQQDDSAEEARWERVGAVKWWRTDGAVEFFKWVTCCAMCISIIILVYSFFCVCFCVHPSTGWVESTVPFRQV